METHGNTHDFLSLYRHLSMLTFYGPLQILRAVADLRFRRSLDQTTFRDGGDASEELAEWLGG